MNEAYQQLLGYITGIWRRRWYVVAIAWLICGAGWTMVASLPDKYESSARIYVDMDTMLGPLMRGIAVEMNLAQQIDLMQRTVFSRPNLEKISMLTDLDLRVTTPEEKDQMLDALGKKVQLVQQGRNLFRVTYEDTDRQLTKRVVQAVLQIFVEGNLGASRKDMDATRKFLTDQLADYEKQLVDSEEKLADFKRKNMGLMPGEKSYHEHLTTVAGDVERTQAYLEEATRVRETLQQQLAEVPQYFTQATSGSSAAAMAMSSGPQDTPLGPESDNSLRIYEMQKSIDALLMRYTENHPDVVVLKKKVEELKQQQKKETEERLKAQKDEGPIEPIPTANGDDNKIPNPLYEQIKLQLVKQESVVAALKQRVETRKEELAKWQQMASYAPQVEAELARLMRDYDVIRKGYQELRARQESAKLARELETKAQKVQFRIIDPPLVPMKPSGPNRPMYLSGVLMGGIGAGLAFAFLLAQINSTFSSVQALRMTFQLPVVGSVTAIRAPGDTWRRNRELVSYAIVCLGLFAAYTGLTAVEMMHKV